MRSMKVWPVVLVLALATVLTGLAQQSQGQREVALVVTGGTVVTVDASHRVIPNGGVAIDGTDIVAVDTAEAIRRQFRGRDTIDATNQVVMPGLVNTHTHAAWPTIWR
jgi:5-methylthioadenosine/S-adenosylhomocysteine deaminase